MAEKRKKKTDLAQTISVIANIGIIAGIVFLAVELRQNQKLVAAQTRNEFTRIEIELQQANRQPEEARLILRGNAGDELTPEEQFRLDRWATMTFHHWQNMEYQYRQGLFDEEEYRAQLELVRDRINGSLVLRKEFCASRDTVSESFYIAVHGLLEQSC